MIKLLSNIELLFTYLNGKWLFVFTLKIWNTYRIRLQVRISIIGS